MSDAHGVARDQLRSFIERIERLEEEKKTIADDIKDVYGEAKGMGFDGKILKKVIAIRKMDREERAEQEAILDTYLAALGMIEQPDFFDERPNRSTGEVSTRLVQQVATGMQTEAGRAALLTAVDIMIDREEKNTRSDAPPASAAAVISSSNDTAKGEAGSPVGLPENSPETADDVTRPAALAVPGGEPSIPSPDNGGAKMDGGTNRYPGRSDEYVGIESTQSGQAVTTPRPAPSMDELRIANALILRPNCKRPGLETCGGQGRTHCRDCIAAPVERMREEA